MELVFKDTPIPHHIIDRWQQVVESIADLLAVPSALINRIDPLVLEVFKGNRSADNPFPSGTRMPLAGVFCEAAVNQRQKVKVSDVSEDPQWSETPGAKAGINAYLGYPLFWPDGEIFGTICALDTQKNRWGERYENLLAAFKEIVEAHLALVDTIEALDAKNRELEKALNEVKTLQGLMPMCASCKKIRDDSGYWNQLESYLKAHSGAEFSHSICPDCAKKLYPDYIK